MTLEEKLKSQVTAAALGNNLPTLDPEQRIQSVLLCLDFRPPETEVIKWVLFLCRSLDEPEGYYAK